MTKELFSQKISRILKESNERNEREMDGYSRQAIPEGSHDHRCEVCDYCKATDDFWEGPKPPVVKRHANGMMLCTFCAYHIYDALTSFEEDDTIPYRLKPTHTYADGELEVKVYPTAPPTYDPLCGSYEYLNHLTEEDHERWREEYAASLKC